MHLNSAAYYLSKDYSPSGGFKVLEALRLSSSSRYVSFESDHAECRLPPRLFCLYCKQISAIWICKRHRFIFLKKKISLSLIMCETFQLQ